MRLWRRDRFVLWRAGGHVSLLRGKTLNGFRRGGRDHPVWVGTSGKDVHEANLTNDGTGDAQTLETFPAGHCSKIIKRA